MFGRIGTTELLLILLIAVVIFGPAKLPKLGKSIGKTIGNFKRSATAAERGETKKKKAAEVEEEDEEV